MYSYMCMINVLLSDHSPLSVVTPSGQYSLDSSSSLNFEENLKNMSRFSQNLTHSLALGMAMIPTISLCNSYY